MWLTFNRPSISWQDAPAFFFELSTDAYRYGMGFYGASRSTRDRLRDYCKLSQVDTRQTCEVLETSQVFPEFSAIFNVNCE